MIEHVYRRAEAAQSVDAVLVATDDERIADTVSAFGGTAVMTRADHPSGTDRLAEVAEALESELIVNVQGDLPLILPNPIDDTVRLMQSRQDLSMGTLRREITRAEDITNPSVVKVVIALDGDALYFSRATIPATRAGNAPAKIWKHMGLYVYRRDFLLRIAQLPETPLEKSESLEQLRVLEHGFRIGTVETTLDTIEVDTPEDLERARQHIEAGVRS